MKDEARLINGRIKLLGGRVAFATEKIENFNSTSLTFH